MAKLNVILWFVLAQILSPGNKTQFTFMAWVKPQEPSQGRRTILAKEGSPNENGEVTWNSYFFNFTPTPLKCFISF